MAMRCHESLQKHPSGRRPCNFEHLFYITAIGGQTSRKLKSNWKPNSKEFQNFPKMSASQPENHLKTLMSKPFRHTKSPAMSEHPEKCPKRCLLTEGDIGVKLRFGVAWNCLQPHHGALRSTLSTLVLTSYYWIS